VRWVEMDGEDAVLLHKRIHGPGEMPDAPVGREGA
jgi:hypothetical protein